MRTAVYDAWFHTMGGGEYHAIAVATALAEIYDEVDIIVHRPASLPQVEPGNDDASDRLQIKVIPLWPDNKLYDFFRTYDLFVNATHESRLHNPSHRGIRLLFFPPKPSSKLWHLADSLLAYVERMGGAPTYAEGFYGPERLGRGWFRASGTDAHIAIHKQKGDYITLMLGLPTGAEAKEVTLSIGDKKLGSTIIEPTNGNFVPFGPIKIPHKTHCARLTLSCNSIDSSVDSNELRELGVLVAGMRTNHVQSILPRVISQSLPHITEEIERVRSRNDSSSMSSYDLILTNSEFSCRWARKWWDIDPKTVYPPVTPIDTGMTEKQPLILSVGRFFAGGHNKKHDIMIKQFKHLIDDGLHGWTLQLIGGQGTTKADTEYMEHILHLADGYPINVSPNLSKPSLDSAYAKASIYWHATGFGEKKSNPSVFEHFGIAAAEAMSAGACPLLFNGGGLSEIIEPHVSGFLWSNTGELTKLSWDLIRNANLRRTIGTQAIKRSKAFHPDKFRSDILKHVDKFL